MIIIVVFIVKLVKAYIFHKKEKELDALMENTLNNGMAMMKENARLMQISINRVGIEGRREVA